MPAIDTPRTDASLILHCRVAAAPVEFTRQLERENDELADALWSLMAAYGASDGRNGNSGECWDKARAVLSKLYPKRAVR